MNSWTRRPLLAGGAALAAALLMASCGGGSDSDGEDAASGDGATSEQTQAAAGLYVGYYAEDAASNPEDPTVGALLFSLPQADGAFSGQMPFSYAGCTAGIDTGVISGTRSGDTISGSWSGVLDESASVGGTLEASYDAALGGFSGSFTNAAGKQAVAVGNCSYYVAASGSFQVWNALTSQPASFALSVGAGTSPAFSWTSLGDGVVYTVRLFDDACVRATPGNVLCFLGEATTTALSAAYPAAFAGASALQAGTAYLAIATGQDGSSGAFKGFASIGFTPSESSSGGDGDDDSGSVGGQLTITGLATADTFTPSGDVLAAEPVTDGPSCVTSGTLSICSSSWTYQWAEVLGQAQNAILTLQIGSASMTQPGPQPGSALNSVVVSLYDGRDPAHYRFTCGVGDGSDCTGGNLALDTGARTADFSQLVLQAQAPRTGSITIDGQLRY